MDTKKIVRNALRTFPVSLVIGIIIGYLITIVFEVRHVAIHSNLKWITGIVVVGYLIHIIANIIREYNKAHA